MIFVKIIGGLGNQMFQYAAARALADRLNVDLYLDLRDFDSYKLYGFGLDRFVVRAKVASDDELEEYPVWRFRLAKTLKKLKFSNRFYIEPSFCFSESWKKLGDRSYLSGYFQSEKYFMNSRESLCKDFQLKNNIYGKNERILKLMDDCESISVHVRRGDYLTNKKTLKIHGVCSYDYYKKAVEIMRLKYGSVRFFIFSNDAVWAKKNLDFGSNAVFITGNEESPEIDLHLMARCRHHILANSSFSWWGAWLGKNLNQCVVAPKPWFDNKRMFATDLLPSSWIEVDK